ncbi:MAG: hypothetical protein IKT82_01365 [Bacteroidaceae bacterium]|nr:hypothetical protein [Bacteroidaceae bacterium]
MLLRHLFFILSLTSMIWGTASCTKLEEEETETPPTENPENNQGGANDDTQSDTLTVVEALQMSPEQWAVVKGYIVGYVDGTSISKAKFSAPTEKANTNLLIADSKSETDYKRCLPIQLKSGTDEHILYNLLHYPQRLGTSIAVEGILTSYFKVNGFKYPDYWITELYDDGSDTPPEEEVPTPTPEPEPNPEPEPESDTPTLDYQPQANICGR